MMLRLCTLATLSFLAAHAQAPAPGGVNNLVRLKFAWPPGMVAHIEAEHSKTTVTPKGRELTSAAIRYRMRVDAHRSGRLISFDQFEPLGASVSASEQAALDQTLSSVSPALIVTKHGEFVGVGDLTAIRTTLRQIIDAAKQRGSGPVPPNIEALLERLTSDEVLSQMAATQWQAFAGAFVGYEGKIGTTMDVESDEPFALLPGVTIPMRTTFGARERVPCRTGSAISCVVMQMRSVVAPGGMQTILKRLVEGMSDLGGASYERFDVTTELFSTLEPSTMRPHQVTYTKVAEMAVVVPGESRASATVTERRTYRIQYP